MATKYIFFDLGKVLLDFDHEQACQQLAELCGGHVDRIRQVVFESGLEDRFETGLLSPQEFCQQIRTSTGAQGSDQDILTALSDIFSPNQGMMPVVAQLAATGFPIGILSNTCIAHWQLVHERYRILRDLFPTVVLSFEVKSMKPDSRIYQRAYGQAKAVVNCEPGEVFFVDDRMENVQGALDCDWDAVLYESAAKLISDLDKRGVKINL